MATEQMSFNLVHAQRLREWREQMSELLYQKPYALSLGGAVSLLIDYWEHQHTQTLGDLPGSEAIVIPSPTVTQLREWAARYPRKGRARSSEAPPRANRGRLANVTGLPPSMAGHSLRWLVADPAVRQCTKCGLSFQSDDALLMCAYADKPDSFVSEAFQTHLAQNPVEWFLGGENLPGNPDQEG